MALVGPGPHTSIVSFLLPIGWSQSDSGQHPLPLIHINQILCRHRDSETWTGYLLCKFVFVARLKSQNNEGERGRLKGRVHRNWCIGDGELTSLRLPVHFRNRERISFDHLVSMKKAGASACLTVLRSGQQCNFNVKLGPVCHLNLLQSLIMFVSQWLVHTEESRASSVQEWQWVA